ncbi:hypothetical protein ACJMK2_042964 [Sinanodonta woodiana]|uniref:Uncharacterized protein n=1 Tax=Sinanodonta woodiana TaxID=1069815 RepID=A0ABD3VVG4_SINWO
MANAMIAEIHATEEKNKPHKQRRVVANIVSGSILRKYKCIAMLSRETGMSRSVLKSANSKGLTAVSRRRRVLERKCLLWKKLDKEGIRYWLNGQREAIYRK